MKGKTRQSTRVSISREDMKTRCHRFSHYTIDLIGVYTIPAIPTIKRPRTEIIELFLAIPRGHFERRNSR
jgi:hypothetical protein